MKVCISQKNNKVLFEINNESGASSYVDGSPEIGGVNGAVRPMELLLGALGSCSVFEVKHILAKQKQALENIRVEVSGERVSNGTAKPFSKIHVVFIIYGNVDERKANRAASLAIDKYCSVKSSLDPSIDVSYEVKINNQ